MKTRLLAFVALLTLLALPSPASADGLELQPPVLGSSVRAFDAVPRYGAGHRGVDLAAPAGSTVTAAATGVVRFAGVVAGTPVVSVDHGNGWRTTYQPVRSLVGEGQTVAAGDLLGTLLAGHCATQACLHWGLTDGIDYADPMSFLPVRRVRLVPHGTSPKPPPSLGAARAAVGGLPVAGVRTSPFGMRRHPVTGVWKLHDGTDLAAPCGTPVVAPTGGRVTRAYYSPSYGWRVFVDHGGGFVTAYNHLPALEVRVGRVLGAGERLGSVGTTGLSTGCHLHWMAWRGGRLVDPLA